jgi:ATP synthase protein I
MLDRWLGTWPWLFLVFFVLGSVAGVLNVYRLFSPRPRPGQK